MRHTNCSRRANHPLNQPTQSYLVSYPNGHSITTMKRNLIFTPSRFQHRLSASPRHRLKSYLSPSTNEISQYCLFHIMQHAQKLVIAIAVQPAIIASYSSSKLIHPIMITFAMPEVHTICSLQNNSRIQLLPLTTEMFVICSTYG
jgi:hypothetical protein